MKGTIIDNNLVKKGKQVVKYWKHNGYAVAEKDLEQIQGVILHTQYDGKLYARRDMFYRNGIENTYNGEKQIILPTKYWEILA